MGKNILSHEWGERPDGLRSKIVPLVYFFTKKVISITSQSILNFCRVIRLVCNYCPKLWWCREEKVFFLTKLVWRFLLMLMILLWSKRNFNRPQQSCGKVMFSFVSRCSHGGVPMWSLPMMHKVSLYSDPPLWTWYLTLQGPPLPTLCWWHVFANILYLFKPVHLMTCPTAVDIWSM